VADEGPGLPAGQLGAAPAAAAPPASGLDIARRAPRPAAATWIGDDAGGGAAVRVIWRLTRSHDRVDLQLLAAEQRKTAEFVQLQSRA
jgi:hypothetical protein